MPAGTNNTSKKPNGGGSSKNKNAGLIESLRDACPPHKHKDLANLVKQHKGEEEKIKQTIAEWWEEDIGNSNAATDDHWEDVKKHKSGKQQPQVSGRGGYKAGRGSGRGGPSGDRAPSRGGGRGGGRGRGRSTQSQPASRTSNKDKAASENKQPATSTAPEETPVVTPTATQALPAAAPRPLQGAWGKKAQQAAPTAPAPSPKVVKPPMPPAVVPTEFINPVAVDTPTQPDMETPVVAPSPSKVPTASTTAGGNVWATKGSAHLIQASKPKPPAPTNKPPQKPRGKPMKPSGGPPSTPKATGVVVVPDASVMPPSPVVDPPGTPSWSTAAASSSPQVTKPSATTKTSAASILSTSVPAASPVSEPRSTQPPAASSSTPVLRMGHWDNVGNEDDNLDIGFGAFGAKVAEPPASPARAPPGLSMPPPTVAGSTATGMPPMPADAVLAHELESKLEQASLEPRQEETTIAATGGPGPNLAQPGLHAYGQYGTTMYTQYGGGTVAAGMGAPFMGMPTTGPEKSATSMYGSVQQAPSSGNSNHSDTAQQHNAAGMPPGMHVPYNPALYYGQQPYHMGQPQGNIGYNYGYGAQYNPQGNFGYMQGQGGYPTHYDDSQSGGGYQKNQGGYRGRNNITNNNNQYQNHYQQYGGPQYNMPYHVQPGPYGGHMQHRDENSYGSRKGGRGQGVHQQGGFNNTQGPHNPHHQQQQGFGFQPAQGDLNGQAGGNNNWPNTNNHHNPPNPAAGGAWAGGAPGWQNK